MAIDDTTEVMLVTSGGINRATKAVPATAHLRAGDAVEVHYRDSRPIGIARYIWVGIPLDAKSISKGPADSAAGSIADLKPASWWNSARMIVTSGKDRRSFQIASDTQLMDRRATLARALTRLPPAVDAIEPNDRVVVVYRRHRATLTARLIRVLPRLIGQ